MTIAGNIQPLPGGETRFIRIDKGANAVTTLYLHRIIMQNLNILIKHKALLRGRLDEALIFI